MSMILDALQRADRERQKQDQPLPSLETPVAPPPVKAPTPKKLWWVTGAGVGLSLMAALLVIALDRPSSPASTSGTPVRPVHAEQPSQVPEPTTEPAAETPTEKPPAIAELYQSPQVEDDSVTALYRTATRDGTPASSAEDASNVVAIEGADGHTQELSDRPEPAAVRLSEAEPAKQAAPEATASKTELSEAESATTESVETAPSETVARESAPAAEPTPTVPGVRDLPWNLQQTMPSLNYQRHDYRNGAASRVVINGQERRAGQQVAPDLTLERIEEDGAVMRYRGHQFKLQALNSWVNM